MKKVFLLTLICLCTVQVMNAQNYDVPPNSEQGKCYERCFDYNKQFEWKEIDCSKIKEQNTKLTEAQLSKIETEKQKMQQYQKKLKALGYKVEVTGIADNQTIIAHHKYLKSQKK